MNENKPITVSDVPGLKLFFKTSGWHDMSLRRFFRLLFTLFFWKRVFMSFRDAILNRYFGSLMGRYSRRLERPFQYLYIGANDGVMSDTIMKYVEKYNWRGILVEPVPYVMEELKKNFKHLKHQTYEQVAISESNGSRKLYPFRKTAHQPIFAQLLHSFSKQSLLDTHISWGINKENDIIAIDVPTTTVTTLLEKHKVKQLDLLVIDTEGYDYTIIKSINLDVIRPTFIKFESMHMSPSELEELDKLFVNHDYKITRMRGDYFVRKIL
jgi:FkbM family methyltransferase